MKLPQDNSTHDETTFNEIPLEVISARWYCYHIELLESKFPRMKLSHDEIVSQFIASKLIYHDIMTTETI